MSVSNWAPKKTKDIYEEEVSMFLAILLQINRSFKVSQRKGSGILDDPYIRTIEYYSTDVEQKQIDKFLKKLRKEASKNLQSLL